MTPPIQNILPQRPYRTSIPTLATTAALAFLALPTLGRAAERVCPFGIGACGQTSQELEKWIPQMEKIGALAAKSLHVNYLEQTIKAGAKGHYDYIVLHPYEVLNGIADHAGTEPIYVNIVPVVRKMLAAQDPSKVNVPIIFTKLGCEAKKGEAAQAHALVKAYVVGIAQGVTCIQWFEGMDGDSGPMGLLQRDGKPRPAYTAMGQMFEHFRQHPSYLGWVLVDDWNYGFVFQKREGQQEVARGHVEARRRAVRERLGLQLLVPFRRGYVQQILHPERHGDEAREANRNRQTRCSRDPQRPRPVEEHLHAHEEKHAYEALHGTGPASSEAAVEPRRSQEDGGANAPRAGKRAQPFPDATRL